MVEAQDVSELFNDARSLHESALSLMEKGDLRDAAEKAWGAVNRATTALVLARTDRLPERSPQVTDELIYLSDDDPRLNELRRSYFDFQGTLHGRCFYWGSMDRPRVIETLIGDVGDYIQQAYWWASY